MLAFLLLFVTLGRLYRDMIKQPETRALLVLAVAVVAVGVMFYMHVEHWSFVNALYFCVVTLGTVGYGDLTPTTDGGKLFTVLYIIVGLSVIGGFFASLGRLIDPQRLLSLRGITADLSREKVELDKERERLDNVIHRDETADAAAPSAEQDKS